MDWLQVVLNGGPPCFHLQEDGRFCGRAERWDGHGHKKSDLHRFVSLEALLLSVISDAKPKAMKDGGKAV